MVDFQRRALSGQQRNREAIGEARPVDAAARWRYRRAAKVTPADSIGVAVGAGGLEIEMELRRFIGEYPRASKGVSALDRITHGILRHVEESPLRHGDRAEDALSADQMGDQAPA